MSSNKFVSFFFIAIITLTGTATAFAQQDGHTAGRVDQIETDIESISAMLDGLGGRIDRIEVDCSGYTTAPARDRCETIGGAQVNDELRQLSAVVNTTAGMLDQLSAGYDRAMREMAERMEANDARMRQMQREVDDLHLQMEQIGQIRDDLAAHRIETEEQFDLAFARIEQVVDGLTEVNRRLDEHDVAIAELRNDVDGLALHAGFAVESTFGDSYGIAMGCGFAELGLGTGGWRAHARFCGGTNLDGEAVHAEEFTAFAPRGSVGRWGLLIRSQVTEGTDDVVGNTTVSAVGGLRAEWLPADWLEVGGFVGLGPTFREDTHASRNVSFGWNGGVSLGFDLVEAFDKD